MRLNTSSRAIDLCGEDDRIHWSTQFGKNVRVGFGTVIEKGCSVGDNTVIAHNCVLRPYTVIGKNCSVGHGTVFEGTATIGNRTKIHSQCHITKGITIEDEVWIGTGFKSANCKNIVHTRKNMVRKFEYPIIRRGARIGSACIMLPGVEIGENSFVGMGSLVTKNVPAKQLWFGNPARYIRQVPENEWL